jgi:hypothetical protein
MTRGSVLLGLLLLGCPSDDEGMEEGGSGPTSASTTMPSTTAGTGTGMDSMSGEPTGDPDSDSATTEGEEDSTGEEGCPESRPMADYTEAEGCGDVIGDGFCSEGGNHVDQDTTVPWEHNPPHSGDHYPTWESWGEHDETVPRGNWVHNMEHGGIVLAYLCPNDSCPDDLDVLRQVIEMRPEARVLMTADPELPGEGFAAISWTWVYRFDEPDLDTLLCFVDQHFNHAPEDVP